MKLTYHIKGILLGSLVFVLTACGGGGGSGPTGVTLGPGTGNSAMDILGGNIGTNIAAVDGALSTLANINGISAMVDADSGQFTTIKNGFEAIKTLKTQVDALSATDKQLLQNMDVWVEMSGCNGGQVGCGKTMSILDAINLGSKMYDRYYEPYKEFWANGAENGKVDDSTSAFAGIKAKVEADEQLSKNDLINMINSDGADKTVTDTNYNIVIYTETSEVIIGTDLTKTVTVSEETVAYNADTVSDYWPTDFDSTTATGCNCTKTYINTTTATQTYDSYREDAVTYKRIDTVYTYSDGSVTTIPGNPEVTNTVTGTTKERNITFSNHQTVSQYVSTSNNGSGGDNNDSDDSDNTANVDYTDTDENLGTKTTGLPTNPDTFINQEFLMGYVDNGYNNAYRDQLKETKINYAWARGWTGKDSKVGVIDTGINTSHQEFTNSIAETKDFTGYGVTDAHGHGTHVAGTIAANRDGEGMVGVAFDSKLYIVKNTHNGYGGGHFGEAMEWLKTHKVDVANISQNNNYDYRISTTGGTIYTLIDANKGIYKFNDSYIKNGHTYTTPESWLQNGYGDAVTEANTWSTYMAGSEIVVVNSAGNQGLPFAAQPGSLAPEVDANGNLKLDGRMIVVGNYRLYDGARLGNHAGTICHNVINDVCQDQYSVSDFFIRAPGYGKSASHTTNDGYAWMSGTSMSAPLVTGSIAVLHQMWPHMTGKNLVRLILETADDTYSGYSVALDGHGRLDMDAATQPVGATGIPTDGRMSGYTISSNGYTAGTNTVPSSVSSLIIETDNTSFNREWLVPIAKASVPVDTAFHDYKSYAGLVTLPVNNDFAVHLKENSMDSLAVTYDGTTVGYMKEDGQYLGRYFNGFFGIGQTETAFVQKSNNFDIADNTTLTTNVNLGYTTVDTVSNSLINKSDDLMSYGWSATTNTKLNDEWSVSGFVAQPVTVFSGSMNINAPTSRSGDNVSYTDTDWTQVAKVETDVGISAQYNKGDFNFTVGGTQRYGTVSGNDYTIQTTFGWKF
jgi:subtilisin family serine protease